MGSAKWGRLTTQTSTQMTAMTYGWGSTGALHLALACRARAGIKWDRLTTHTSTQITAMTCRKTFRHARLQLQQT